MTDRETLLVCAEDLQQGLILQRLDTVALRTVVDNTLNGAEDVSCFRDDPHVVVDLVGARTLVDVSPRN